MRDRLLFRIGAERALGPEIIFKGGRDYEGWQAGIACGGIRIRENLGLLVRGGISAQQGEANTGYASVEPVLDLLPSVPLRTQRNPGA